MSRYMVVTVAEVSPKVRNAAAGNPARAITRFEERA
jgi:hypothetical protein